MMEGRFNNKLAIITGGATGIGKAVAFRLGKEGATVALFDNNEIILQETVAEFKQKGIRANGFLVNISLEKDVASAIQQVIEEFGEIDIMVNSAGIVGPTSTKIIDYSSEEFARICDINLKGSFLMSKYTLQSMVKRGAGRILLISSISGKEGNPGMVGYSASKAGVIGLVKGIAKEFADTQITVNGIAPAVIRTSMNEKTSPEQLAYMTAKIPMQRLGTVEEVAAMCCFIVSDENSFSTGFIFDISGGRATY